MKRAIGATLSFFVEVELVSVLFGNWNASLLGWSRTAFVAASRTNVYERNASYYKSLQNSAGHVAVRFRGRCKGRIAWLAAVQIEAVPTASK